MIALYFMLAAQAAESEQNYTNGTNNTDNQTHQCLGQSCYDTNVDNSNLCFLDWAADSIAFAAVNGACSSPTFIAASCTDDQWGCSYANNDDVCFYICNSMSFHWTHYTGVKGIINGTLDWVLD